MNFYESSVLSYIIIMPTVQADRKYIHCEIFRQNPAPSMIELWAQWRKALKQKVNITKRQFHDEYMAMWNLF